MYVYIETVGKLQKMVLAVKRSPLHPFYVPLGPLNNLYAGLGFRSHSESTYKLLFNSSVLLKGLLASCGIVRVEASGCEKMLIDIDADFNPALAAPQHPKRAPCAKHFARRQS